MREWAWLIVVLICHTVPFAAQDIDSNPLIQKRSVSSIADQIADSSERSAFLQPVRKPFWTNFRSRRFWHKLMKLRLARVLICVSMGRGWSMHVIHWCSFRRILSC
jgi:hypothetical protein